MSYLIFVSLIWGLSFGLIKTHLSTLDPFLVACIRLGLSFLLFAPLLRFKGLQPRIAYWLILIGAIQYGLMYLFYLWSFQMLLAYEVALFTVFTPLYVTLLEDLLNRKLTPFFLLTAGLAVLGTIVAVWDKRFDGHIRLGFLLVQFSNLTFAAGQVLYRRIMRNKGTLKEQHIFGLLYLGGLLVALIGLSARPNLSFVFNWKQVAVLLYLGLIASGFCFFLWNYGARKVNAGALAILNNLKMPLGVLCAMLLFGEKGNYLRLGVSFSILAAALWLNECWNNRHPSTRSGVSEERR